MHDEAKAKRTIDFINSLKHTKGKWHGVPFTLLPWQQKIISDIFGTVKENGYTAVIVNLKAAGGKIYYKTASDMALSDETAVGNIFLKPS